MNTLNTFIPMINALLKLTTSLLILLTNNVNPTTNKKPSNLNNIKPKLPYCIVHKAIGLSSTATLFQSIIVDTMSGIFITKK